jgi:hypothetical protein
MVAKTAAKAAAKPAPKAKTAPKATTKKAAPATIDDDDDEPDLLADITSPNVDVDDDDDEDFDLLSDMSESSATAWMPWDEDLDDEQPEAIQGKLVHIGTVTQDSKYGGDDVPYWEIQDKNDPDVTWGIRGYATVLRNKMEREQDNGLQVGDIAAISHWGLKSNKKGDNDYRDFGLKTAKKKR